MRNINMGQYKLMISFIKGFKIGFDIEWKWEINIYLGSFRLFIGLADYASGYNLFDKWFKK